MNRQTNLVWIIVFVVILKEISGESCAGHDLFMYTGNVSVSNGGRVCQSWTSQTPHFHLFNDDLFFPLDSSVEDAANYCRNTGQETDDGDRRPWCYTTDPRKPRDYCNKPICGEPVCGGLRLEPTGLLTAPDTDADGYYDTDIDCLWTIVAPEDTLIEFEVLQISIEPATRACFFDFLAIYENTRHYGRYCSTIGPPVIRSRSNTLYVRFYSDTFTTYPGFIAKYTQVNATTIDGTTEAPGELPDYPVGNVMCPADVDIGLYTGKVNVTGTGRTCAHWKDLPHMYEGSSAEDENFCRNFMNSPLPWCETTHGTLDYCEETVCKGAPCGGNVTSHSGWLSGVDRNNDGDYDIYRECLWTLIAPADHGIMVKILFLSIEDISSCETEVLMIYVKVTEIKRFCGRPLSLPIILKFSSNLLYVRFYSWKARGAPGPGFNLTYLHVTDVSLTVTPSKTVTASTTVNTTGVDIGLVSVPLKTTEKGTGSTENIRGPTTASGSANSRPTGIDCIMMFNLCNTIYFKLAQV